MLDQQVDYGSFQRLDNAAVVDFLTSAAGAFAEAGLLTAKDTDNLRLVLSGINSDAGAREQPILLALERQTSDFLAMLEARYGVPGLCLNLLRHSLRQPLADTRRTLADWGQGLLKKAELHFNRPLYLTLSQPRDRQALVSTVLVDFAEMLSRVCVELEAVVEELAAMNPCALAGAGADDEALDLAVARACGFTALVRQALPVASERALKRRVAAVVGQVAEEALALAAQLSANANAKTGTGYGIVATCEQLVAESQRLALLDLPDSDNLLHWEVRRRSLVATVLSLGEALRQLAATTLEALSSEQLGATTPSPGLYPEAAKRRVAFALLTGGVPAAKAWTATRDLFRYLEEHQLTPREILPGELAKINATLTVAALEALARAAADQSLTSQSLPEKSATLGRAKRLASTFAVALGLSVSGCGLKTRPQSDVPDFRPDILFHPAAPEPTPAPAPAQPAVDAAAPADENSGTNPPASVPNKDRP